MTRIDVTVGEVVYEISFGDVVYEVTLSGGGGGGGHDEYAVHVNAAGEIAGVAVKATLADDDKILIEDSAAGDEKKHILASSLPGASGGDPDQNIYETVTGNTGSTTASTPNDILGIDGGVGIDTAVTPDTVTVNLEDTPVTPGIYTNTDITVDQQGRITAASDGTGGGGDVTGPASSANDNVVAFDGVTGKLIKDSGSPVSDIVANTAHRSSDGKDHSDVVANTGHRVSDGKDHSDVVLNNGHRLGSGSDHSDVAANSADRHAEIHTVASHGDTSATGAELDELVGGGLTALHSHAGGGTTDEDAIHDNVPAEISIMPVEKTNVVGTDWIIVEDSENADSKVKVQVGNLPAGAAEHGNHAGDVTSVGLVTTIPPQTIDYPKIQNVNSQRIMGRDTAGLGVMEEMDAATVLLMLNVEAGADVTDSDNVAAAGAIMHTNISEDEGYLRKTGVDTYVAVKTNLLADVDPDSFLDGSNNGYAVTSRWINNATATEFVCVDATPGNARWKETTAEAVVVEDQNLYETFTGNTGSTTANDPQDVLNIAGRVGIVTEGSDDQIAIDLEDTTVVPGDYTSANISVDPQGRITAAESGSGGGGEVNTAKSIGTGASLYSQKVGVDLQFNSLLSINNILAITLDGVLNDLHLQVIEGNINHDNLLRGHNLSTDIDHDKLLNYVIDQHRIIDDAGISTTELWSSSFLNSLFALKQGVDAQGNVSFAGNVTFNSLVDVLGSGPQVIDYTTSNKAKLTPTGDVTLTFVFPGIGNYVLQTEGSVYAITWPVGVKFPGGFNPSTVGDSLIGIYYDGTDAWATFTEDMQ